MRARAATTRRAPEIPVTEMVDIVDAEDRVLRRATRAEMRRDNLLHRAVYVLVRNGRGELFVHRRTESKDIHPSHWDVTIGGVVAAGETYAAAAERELHEEIGVRATALRPLGPLRYEDAKTRIHGRVFAATADGPLRLQAEEIAEGRFMAADEVARVIAERACCPDGLLVLRTYGGTVTGG
jgi:isopentenyldiphosphate isomerase